MPSLRNSRAAMSATVAPSRPGDQRVAFPSGQRTAAAGQGRGGERRVDDPFATRDPPYGVGQLLDRRVLDHEAEHAGLHRPAQVARPAERREHQHLAAGHLAAQGGRGGKPVQAGHLDVEQGDVGSVLERRGDDLVAAGHLGDDLEVVLEVEQHRQRTSYEMLVVGQQDPDHAGTSTRSR